MSNHTPGQWRFYTEPQPNGCPVVGANGLMVCMLAHTVNQPEQRETALANARLIAAAPELLKALKLAVQQNDHDMQMTGDELRICRAAIAKAEGKQ